MFKYIIYQIKDIEACDYAFRDYSPKKFNFLNDYDKVYEHDISGEIVDAKAFDEELCEKLFEIFNINKPADFKGHSLSVSDIVEINSDGHRKLYYCNSLGWKRI